MSRRLILAALLALAACKMSLPGAEPKPDAAASATPAEISTTSLDAQQGGKVPDAAKTAPPPKPAENAAPAKPAGKAVAPAVAAKAGKPQMSAAEVKPTTDPDAQAAVDAAAKAAEPPPEVIKSPAQLACEKQKGVYSKVGGGNARACVRETRDAGHRCSKKSDCEGQCLARSQTCSPITPLFGCQDILGMNGERMTQCID